MTNARRVQQVRSSARVRRWEFRQRNLAHGAWHQFRLALAMAQSAYAINDADYAGLVAEGFASDDRGKRLVPERKLVWISAERARRLDRAAPLEMRFDANMLASRVLALVPFDEEDQRLDAAIEALNEFDEKSGSFSDD